MRRTLINSVGKPLLNHRGVPIVRNFSLHEGARQQNRWGDVYDHFYHQSNRDMEKLTGPDGLRRLRSVGRFLIANSPLVRGVLMEQANYSFPLEPMYVGPDKEWGMEAKAWLWEWKKQQNILGYPYDCQTNSRIRLINRKGDGDIATILLKDEEGAPRIKILRAHRIWNRDTPHGDVIKSGPYAGARMTMGVIRDRMERPIAYHVLGDQPEQDMDVPATAMYLTFRPEAPEQCRGISEMCASVMSFSDIKRLREYELRAQQIQSAYAIVEKNEEGEAPPGADFITSPDDGTDASGSASGFNYRTYEGGLHQYFRSNSGAGLELVRPDRPGADSQAFEDRIVSAALYGLEWDPHFALAIKEPGGAWARTTLEKIRRCIQNNQAIEVDCVRREDAFALAVAVEDLGLLPPPSDGDVTAWEYQGPARFTADSGNEENAKREAYKLGTDTLANQDAEKGRWWEDTRAQKEIETRDLLDRASGLAADYGLTIQEALTLLEDRGSSLPVHQPEQTAPQARKSPSYID